MVPSCLAPVQIDHGRPVPLTYCGRARLARTEASGRSPAQSCAPPRLLFSVDSKLRRLRLVHVVLAKIVYPMGRPFYRPAAELVQSLGSSGTARAQAQPEPCLVFHKRKLLGSADIVIRC